MEGNLFWEADEKHSLLCGWRTNLVVHRHHFRHVFLEEQKTRDIVTIWFFKNRTFQEIGMKQTT